MFKARFLKIQKIFNSLPLNLAISYLLSNSLFRLFNSYGRITYSQTGEDFVLDYLLKNYTNGYYIDIGCNHPIKISNTFNFYMRGWKGICIDANSDLAERFKLVRKRDVVLDAALSDDERETVFYEFYTDAVSTLDIAHKREWEKTNIIKNERKLKTIKLSTVLENCLPLNQSITFMSIDVEGHDLAVLKSNDFTKYRPIIVLVEIHNVNIEIIFKNPIYIFMKANGYSLVNYATMNAYFMDISSLEYQNWCFD